MRAAVREKLRVSLIGRRWPPRTPLERIRERLRSVAPRPAVAEPDKLAQAEEIGRRMGLTDRHCLPYLDFDTAEEWLAFLKGHRAGQAELRELRRRSDQ